MSKKTVTYQLGFLLILAFFGCQNVSVPKPKAFLTLDYPPAIYETVKINLPWTFDKNEFSELEVSKKNNQIEGVNLNYKPLNAVIFMSYKPVKNNFKDLVQSSLAITQQHAKVAHGVSEKEFQNGNKKVYGKIYDLSGPVASQIQFYASDSTNHFLSGAVYFNIKPNYDSIFPATRYLQKDIVRLMESLEWEN